MTRTNTPAARLSYIANTLALLKEGKTAYYTCYNAAVCMIPYFETHHYEMWAKHKEHFFKAAERNEDSHLDIHSGYYAYYFITKNFMGDTFENSIINCVNGKRMSMVCRYA